MILGNGGALCDVLVVVHQDETGAITEVETVRWEWDSEFPPQRKAQDNAGQMVVRLDDGSRASYYHKQITLPYKDGKVNLDG